MAPIDELAASTYALLTTYRRNGQAVATPVWVVSLPNGLGVWTAANTGKVKRIRANPSVTIATCDARGGNAGPAYSGKAVILDARGSEEVRAQIKRKYRLAGRLLVGLSKLRRGRSGTVGIHISLTE